VGKTIVVPRFLLAALLLACSAHGRQSARQELEQVLDKQVSAWNRGDLVAFMNTYVNSPELTFFFGDTIAKGWEATLARYRKRYQGAGKEMGQLSFTDTQVDMLSPEAAVVTARWHLVMHDGKKLEGLTTIVCKRTRNGWKIVHDHSS
jgi:beta-aspartyl-peptidase (threonine type)